MKSVKSVIPYPPFSRAHVLCGVWDGQLTRGEKGDGKPLTSLISLTVILGGIVAGVLCVLVVAEDGKEIAP